MPRPHLAATPSTLPPSVPPLPRERKPERTAAAGFTSGLAYLVLAGFSTALVSVVNQAPAGMLEAVAGLALLGTLASAISAALADRQDRIAPAVTFLMAASGLAFAGIGSAFWALLAGLAVRAALFRPAAPEPSGGGPETR